MAKPILPEVIREDIKQLLKKGYTRDAVFEFIEDETANYVKSGKQLERCIVGIERIVPEIPERRIKCPEPPKSKEFDPILYKREIDNLKKGIPLKKIEKIGVKVAKYILKNYEKLKRIKDGPEFAGTPFDLFGFRDKNPYIIELKASLHSFNYPGEIQKIRIQELLKNIKGLRVALIQIKLKEAEYRIFYDNQMDLLFYCSKMPLGPIEQWIKDRI